MKIPHLLIVCVSLNISFESRYSFQSGKHRAYGLGEFLRERYSDLLPEDGSYDPSNIYVQCTNFNRTVETAKCVLAGMFDVINYSNYDCPSQPVPINVIPTNEDDLLHGARHCALYNEDQSTIIARKNEKMFKEHLPLVEYLTKHSGENITDIRLIAAIYDILSIEDRKNYT